jgi:hypothetical protein
MGNKKSDWVIKKSDWVIKKSDWVNIVIGPGV